MTLIKAGKLSFKFAVLFLLILATASFFGLKNAKADEIKPTQSVIINELMWMGSSVSSYDEWIELYNPTDKTIILSDWQLTSWSSTQNKELPMLTIPAISFIHPHDFFLISNYNFGDSTHTILNIKPDLVDPSVTLSNTYLQIKLYDSNNNLIDVAGDNKIQNPFYGLNKSGQSKASMQRNEIIEDGTLPTSWHTATESLNFIDTALEKATPQLSNNTPPPSPTIIGPVNNQELISDKLLHFSWTPSMDFENDNVSYQLKISCLNQSDQSWLIKDILENYYDINSIDLFNELDQCSQYFWQIGASDGELINFSPTSSFFVIKPVINNSDSNQDPIQQINTIPIEIPTGDFKNYLNKLVKVTGEVISTSGNTFYLDDGSGEAKIYIQSKTHIDKPPMHKGDIFEVTGLVDLYGASNWRVLPQNQDDVRLVEATLASVATTAKSTSKKVTTAAVSISLPSNTTNSDKKIAAAEDPNDKTNDSSNQKTPFWIQIIEAIVGLVFILLIIFIIKIIRTPKPKTIGGHFGDDET